MALYNATSGPSWLNNTNWGTGDPCRKFATRKPNPMGSLAATAMSDEYYEATPWFGVGCLDPCDDVLDGEACTAGRILSLDLAENGLNGSLSEWEGVREALIHDIPGVDDRRGHVFSRAWRSKGFGMRERESGRSASKLRRVLTNPKYMYSRSLGGRTLSFYWRRAQATSDE